MLTAAAKDITLLAKKYPFQAFLVIVITAGLLCKLYISLNLDLNSDTVGPGIVLMEMFKHGNYGLSGYYFPVLDPYLYTEILPFHAAAQLVSGYNPAALMLTSYLLFLAILVVYASIALYVSRDVTKMLIFIALVATIDPASYFYYASPAMHNATILYAGIFLLMFLAIRGNNWKFMALATIASGIIVYSDSIFLAYFVVPSAVCFLLFGRKSLASLLYYSVFLAVSIGALLIKYLLPWFALSHADLALLSIDDLGPRLGLFAWRLAELLGIAFGSQIPANSPSLFGYLVILLFIGLAVAFAFYARGQKSPESRYLMVSFAVSALIFSPVLILTNMPLYDAHYLTFVVLGFLLLLSVVLKSDRLTLSLITVLVVACLLANLLYVLSLDHRPNAEEYDLIEVLESNNLTYGYANYWDANVITYLSGETVTVRSIRYDFESDEYVPHRWLSCEQWYQPRPGDFFLVSSTATYPLPHVLVLPYDVSPDRYYQSGNCLVFVYNQSNMAGWLNTTRPL